MATIKTKRALVREHLPGPLAELVIGYHFDLPRITATTMTRNSMSFIKVIRSEGAKHLAIQRIVARFEANKAKFTRLLGMEWPKEFDEVQPTFLDCLINGRVAVGTQWDQIAGMCEMIERM